MRRPKLAAALSAGVLVALALPALGMKTVDPGVDALPQDLSAVQVYNRLQTAFPGEQAPAVVVVRAPAIDGDVEDAIAELLRQAVASGAAHEPISTEVNTDRTVARLHGRAFARTLDRAGLVTPEPKKRPKTVSPSSAPPQASR